MGFIYKFTSPSGKHYIGQTIQDINMRFRQHKSRSLSDIDKNCRALYAAIKKYGFDSFERKVIMECDDEDLNFFEALYIKAYNSIAPNGYNLTSGGDSDYNTSTETKELISKIVKQRWNISDLPMYIGTVRKDGTLIGYKVRHHPADPKQVKFINQDNIAKALEDAKLYLDLLNSKKNETNIEEIIDHSTGRRRKVEYKNNPKYLYTIKEKGQLVGYKISGHPTIKSKKFHCASNLQVAYERAITYLESFNV
jgi:group I intron endonuclease